MRGSSSTSSKREGIIGKDNRGKKKICKVVTMIEQMKLKQWSLHNRPPETNEDLILKRIGLREPLHVGCSEKGLGRYSPNLVFLYEIVRL